jgi:hypothetical protein
LVLKRLSSFKVLWSLGGDCFLIWSAMSFTTLQIFGVSVRDAFVDWFLSIVWFSPSCGLFLTGGSNNLSSI